MAQGLSKEEVAFRNAVHKALTGNGVFPEGHEWAGMTKAESLLAVRQGQTAAQFLAAKAPAEPVEKPVEKAKPVK